MLAMSGQGGLEECIVTCEAFASWRICVIGKLLELTQLCARDDVSDIDGEHC